MSRCNAPEIFFPRYRVAQGRAQEPSPGSFYTIIMYISKSCSLMVTSEERACDILNVNISQIQSIFAPR